ncbi:Acyl dehydratase [Salinihabitans flavidus]|uniref:Acyl dehydratase n=1 Tax=Salinihabitans flavidus TaxID=569882 RepID=A0A1H8MCN5_9RHOB|nr:MaoC/PaaZ C-terminal domain-containing protein [Salinihabitans flavidus]SEO15083.1 Acyl dehydratase [Salinihabitans flavidus]
MTPQTARPGDSLPPLTFGPITRAMLALYAGASGDHNPIHIDIDFARQAGQQDVFAHGMLSMAQLGRLVTGWAGQDRLLALSARFTAITPVGATLTLTGDVTERLEIDGNPVLHLTLAATLADGTRTLRGQATVCAA